MLEYWNIALVESTNINRSTHHSIIPISLFLCPTNVQFLKILLRFWAGNFIGLYLR
jgi:hypothetical protein